MQQVQFLLVMLASHNNDLQHLVTVLLNGPFSPGLSCVWLLWCMWVR